MPLCMRVCVCGGGEGHREGACVGGLFVQEHCHTCTCSPPPASPSPPLIPMSPPPLHPQLTKAASCVSSSMLEYAGSVALMAVRRMPVPVLVLKSSAKFVENCIKEGGCMGSAGGVCSISFVESCIKEGGCMGSGGGAVASALWRAASRRVGAWGQVGGQ